MLFNSLNFLIFLPIVFFIYWFVAKKKLKLQNLILLIASCFFYSCWDIRFLFLLIFSILLDYYCGVKIYQAVIQKQKKTWLLLSLVINLGILGVFKYYNFFSSSFTEFLSLIGLNVNSNTIQIILPVGISFYTFHGLSYVIDIYKDKIIPEKNLVNYALFVSFFPLLVAGPIERATHLLPQIINPRVFNYPKAVDGLRQILWGLFKKVVIADNCAEIANIIFNNPSGFSSITLVLGALFFTFQIYCDFSGYSDIALGTARLFGIELLINFSFPYFSRDIAEFWRRWHISLSSWFRDYVYIPLGGSKGGKWMRIRNTFVIFVISGFWHGANWTFIFWGVLNAIYIMPSIIYNTNRNNIEIVAKGKYMPTIKEFFSIIITFALTVFAWIFFRSTTIKDALLYIKLLFSKSLISLPDFTGIEKSLIIIPFICFLLIIEWLGREQQFALSNIGLKWKRIYRISFYYLIIFFIFIFGGKDQQFIYFQF